MNAISLIEKNAYSIPEKSALTYKSGNAWQTLSWKLFWEGVCRVANGLAQTGVQKGECIGIFSQNSKDWIILDIAAQAMGAVPVPIYATNSKDQAKFIITQADIKYVLAGGLPQYEILNSIRTFHQKELHIFTSAPLERYQATDYHFSTWSRQFSTTFRYEEPDPGDASTIIYTSGTTGEPKGVTLTNKNTTAVIEAHKKFFSIDNLHQCRSLAFLPLSHVFEREWTIFVLSQGGEVVVLDEPKNVLQALKEVKPTAMCAVPRFYEKVYQTLMSKINNSGSLKQSLFKSALKTGRQYAECRQFNKSVPAALKAKFSFFNTLVFKKIKNELGGRLNFLPVGGAMLKKEISEFMAAVGIPVIVGYGLTETSATVTAYPPENFVHGSVGKALPGVDIRIGPQDEILVKYEGVMAGYYKNQEETEKVFTASGYFKTGDCGRIDEQGNLFITDRIKDLMKTSNGKYIAPQPIENALQVHPEILQAMMIADGKPYATALIVPDYETLANEFPDFKHFQNMSVNDKASLLNNSAAVKNKYDALLSSLQQKHAPYEKIKKFYLLPEEFTIANGDLTPTLKIKRREILQKKEDLIDSMYS